MGDDRRILLGHIAGAHGIRGEVLIKSHTAAPEDIASYGPLSDANGTRAFTIKVVRLTPKGVIARVAGVSDRNAAEAIRGAELYVARSALGKPADGEYFYSDLIGLAAVAPDGTAIGTIKAVENFGAGDLLEIEFPLSRRTEYVAFTDANVPSVDVAAGKMVVIMPTDDGSNRQDEPPDAE